MKKGLTSDERRILLEIARDAIRSRLEGSDPPDHHIDSGALSEHRGAFVTLTIEGHLRGCIGHVVGVEPLWKSVRSNAVSAAFKDPRFEPLRPDELDVVEIEVSALSQLQEVDDPESIEVGVHGLLVEKEAARGLLLPQVATNNGWNRTTFLEHTCRKAGLEPGCWKHPDATFSTFTVESFAEG